CCELPLVNATEARARAAERAAESANGCSCAETSRSGATRCGSVDAASPFSAAISKTAGTLRSMLEKPGTLCAVADVVLAVRTIAAMVNILKNIPTPSLRRFHFFAAHASLYACPANGNRSGRLHFVHVACMRALQPPVPKPGPSKSSHDVSARAHQPPEKLGTVVLAHQYDRPQIDAEVV